MNDQLSEHFSRHEFSCKCGCGWDTVDAVLIRGLEALRALAARPIHINSGCRCATHNAAIGGSPKSQHLLGKAADIVIDGLPPEQVKSLAERVTVFSDGGIGIYKTFVHVDARGWASRWDNRR